MGLKLVSLNLRVGTLLGFGGGCALGEDALISANDWGANGVEDALISADDESKYSGGGGRCSQSVAAVGFGYAVESSAAVSNKDWSPSSPSCFDLLDALCLSQPSLSMELFAFETLEVYQKKEKSET